MSRRNGASDNGAKGFGPGIQGQRLALASKQDFGDARMDVYILALRAGDGPLVAARTAGVTPAAVEEWRQKDPIFSRACDRIFEQRRRAEKRNAKAGKTNGAAVKRSMVTVNAQAQSGLPMPLDVLLSGMRMFTAEIDDLNDFDANPLGKGETVEERKLRITQIYAAAMDVAHKAAPYCHPKLASLRVEQEAGDQGHEMMDVDDYLQSIEEERRALGLPDLKRLSRPLNGN